jgi:hypothetical protein
MNYDQTLIEAYKAMIDLRTRQIEEIRQGGYYRFGSMILSCFKNPLNIVKLIKEATKSLRR